MTRPRGEAWSLGPHSTSRVAPGWAWLILPHRYNHNRRSLLEKGETCPPISLPGATGQDPLAPPSPFSRVFCFVFETGPY